jgi:CHAT domain-containing protein
LCLPRRDRQHLSQSATVQDLYQKKLDKAQALRQAMLKMMEKYRDNPRAWAAFTLIGEAE